MIVSIEGLVPLTEYPKKGSKVVVLTKKYTQMFPVGTVGRVGARPNMIYADGEFWFYSPNELAAYKAVRKKVKKWCYMFQRLASGSGIKIPKDDPLYKVGKK